MKVIIHPCNEHALLLSFLREELIIPFEFQLELTNENYILFVIKNKIAAFGSISKQNNFQTEYSYKIELTHITEPSKRIPFTFPFPNDFSTPIDSDEMSYSGLFEQIEKSEYSFSFYFQNAEDMLISEETKIKKQKNKEKTRNKFSPKKEKIQYRNISEPHLKAQYILKEIGDIIGLQSFVAKNDKNKLYNNELLSLGCLNEFPNFNVSKELKNHLSLIDTIWFDQHGIPKAAFEVELSTSVFSGILRLSDLLCTIGNNDLNLYLVTTKARENKIKKELSRPIFRNIGLSEHLKVIYLDDLDKLYSLIKPLKGHIKESVLEKITYSYSELMEYDLIHN